jgi:hypothetical protein
MRVHRDTFVSSLINFLADGELFYRDFNRRLCDDLDFTRSTEKMVDRSSTSHATNDTLRLSFRGASIDSLNQSILTPAPRPCAIRLLSALRLPIPMLRLRSHRTGRLTLTPTRISSFTADMTRRIYLGLRKFRRANRMASSPSTLPISKSKSRAKTDGHSHGSSAQRLLEFMILTARATHRTANPNQQIWLTRSVPDQGCRFPYSRLTLFLLNPIRS